MSSKKTSLPIWTYFFWPLVFIGVCWLVWLYDFQYGIHSKWGIEPRTLKGLRGILFSPFLHQDFNHLINNSAPLLLLGSTLFFFYPQLPFKVFFWLYIGGGTWLWCLGRSGNHIGASGIVYGLFAFILLGGLMSKNKRLMAMSFLSVFIYGSMLWGIFPMDDNISWEGHLTSLLWGIILAVVYRKYLPQPQLVSLSEDDSLNEARFGPDYWKKAEQINTQDENPETRINYVYKPKDN